MDPLRSDRPLIVYLDFKSPYAYLAWQPTRDMARELGIAIDWRPFVLDIPSYLGSAKLDKSGKMAEHTRSPEQWSGVKYAYYDCRRYANLRGLTVRGTTKIWNTELAAIGMLWAKQQGDEILEGYVERVYEPFWKRELDLEDPVVISSVLERAGAELDGFDDYRLGAGAAANSELQSASFDAGIFGVPSYVVDGELYFGREHLPRLRWMLSGKASPPPTIANELPIGADIKPGQVKSLEVCIDFHCAASYLCLAPTLALAADLGLPITWHPRTSRPRRLEPSDGSRGARHRSFRALYQDTVASRYAGHPLPAGGPDSDSRIPALTLLWLQERAMTRIDEFLTRCYTALWREQRSFNDSTDMEALLEELGVDCGGLKEFIDSDGPATLAASQAATSARGCWDTPTYFLDDEPYLGQQHLPLIRARLGS